MNTISITEPMIIDHLLPTHDPDNGVHVEEFDYVVTQDDFDEDDNQAPGHYAGVAVDADTASKWDRGLAACKAAGLHSRSPEGVALRYSIMHGAEAPDELIEWARRAQASRAEAEQAAAEQKTLEAAELVAFEGLVAGYQSVGPDDYSGRWWGKEDAELELLGEWREPDRGQLRRQQRKAYRLPDGDIMVVFGRESWCRYTKDAELIVDTQRRRAIKGYRYDEQLFAALAELELAGALSVGYASWFGGTHGLHNPTGAFAGPRNATAAEKIKQLRSWLEQCVELHPKHAEALRAAGQLVIDESIICEVAS